MNLVRGDGGGGSLDGVGGSIWNVRFCLLEPGGKFLVDGYLVLGLGGLKGKKREEQGEGG